MSNLMVSAELGIRHLVSTRTRLPCEEKLAVLDSLITRNILPAYEIRNALELVGTAISHRALNLLSPSTDSGIESQFRSFLTGKRIKFVEQAWIGSYRVDFLIGRSLIVELVGAETHMRREQFERDATREAWLHTQGYTIVRFSGEQILYKMREVEDTMSTIVGLGRHRQRLRSPMPSGSDHNSYSQ